jgi:hypothetical protein
MILGPNGRRLIKSNGKFAVGTDCCCDDESPPTCAEFCDRVADYNQLIVAFPYSCGSLTYSQADPGVIRRARVLPVSGTLVFNIALEVDSCSVSGTTATAVLSDRNDGTYFANMFVTVETESLGGSTCPDDTQRDWAGATVGASLQYQVSGASVTIVYDCTNEIFDIDFAMSSTQLIASSFIPWTCGTVENPQSICDLPEGGPYECPFGAYGYVLSTQIPFIFQNSVSATVGASVDLADEAWTGGAINAVAATDPGKCFGPGRFELRQSGI